MARKRKTFHLDEDLIQRIDNAVAACAGAPEYLDLASFAEIHLTRGVSALERKHNEGEPFPAAKLPRGRPARPAA